MARHKDGLAEHFLVIHYAGYEGEIVLLDTTDGSVHLMRYGKIHKIADSFNEWFEKEILSYP